MFKSMTGFGRGEYLDSDHRFIVEIRAVNHRFNDIVLRIPKHLGALEDRVRKSIAGTLARGRIDVVVNNAAINLARLGWGMTRVLSYQVAAAVAAGERCITHPPRASSGPVACRRPWPDR